MKMLIRRTRRPKYASSATSSMRATLPCAGAITPPSVAGATRAGSRKNAARQADRANGKNAHAVQNHAAAPVTASANAMEGSPSRATGILIPHLSSLLYAIAPRMSKAPTPLRRPSLRCAPPRIPSVLEDPCRPTLARMIPPGRWCAHGELLCYHCGGAIRQKERCAGVGSRGSGYFSLSL